MGLCLACLPVMLRYASSASRSNEGRAHLAAADWDVAKREAWVARHQKLIEGLIAAGQDTTEAERLLSNLDDLLNLARTHRQLILRRLEEQ
jgi:predicted outer membrane protein